MAISGVGVEWVFIATWQVCSSQQHWLSRDKITKVMMVQVWDSSAEHNNVGEKGDVDKVEQAADVDNSRILGDAEHKMADKEYINDDENCD